jgi:hypothetical protein
MHAATLMPACFAASELEERLMLRGTILSAMFFSAMLPALAAEQCPAGLVGIDQIERAIRATPTCQRAFNLFDACRYNSSGDVALSAVVIRKCEAGFASRLTPDRRKRYQSEISACRRKYEHESGTLYVSFAVTCEAMVAVKYQRAMRR